VCVCVRVVVVVVVVGQPVSPPGPTMEGLNKAQRGALQSRLVVSAVATLSGLFIKYASRLETRGLDRWVRVLQVDPVTGQPRSGRPLITVANHVSCLDDPLLMGALPWRTLLKASWTGRMRWTPGSRRICYANPLLGYFFGLGQVIPVSWGLGVFQDGMRIAQSRLERGDWVHIFPEGRVNQSGRVWPVKWGVGQLIMETKRKLGVSPIILSLAHTGARLQLCAFNGRRSLRCFALTFCFLLRFRGLALCRDGERAVGGAGLHPAAVSARSAGRRRAVRRRRGHGLPRRARESRRGRAGAHHRRGRNEHSRPRAQAAVPSRELAAGRLTWRAITKAGPV